VPRKPGWVHTRRKFELERPAQVRRELPPRASSCDPQVASEKIKIRARTASASGHATLDSDSHRIIAHRQLKSPTSRASVLIEPSP